MMMSDEIFAFYGIALWFLMLEIPTQTHRKREGEIKSILQ